MHDIVTRLRDFFDRPNPVLFAGAGVGSRVGFPTWDTYIKYLADVCDRFNDHESAVLIRRRLDQRQHLGAVSVFKTTHLIPTGERWKALAEPFTRDATNPDKLDALVGLPFSAIVTTNYDHSLHDVHSKVFHKWVTPVDRGSLRSSSQSRDYFIARIHGTAENPTSMAVDTNDYEKLGQEDDYLDFLLNLLRTRSCLFFGFSFLDPAIRHVLDIHAQRHGPVFDKLHLALIPTNQPELVQELHAVNIEVVEYDSHGQHVDAWRAIRELHDVCSVSTPTPVRPIDPTFGHSSLHRFLAFTHVQAHIRQHSQPITDIARDGLVASLISSASGSVDQEVIRTEVASLLGLSSVEARQVVATSIDRLVARECVRRGASTMAWIGPTESRVDRDLAQLTENVLRRMRVRYGVRATTQDQRASTVLIENVLMTRAWDLGAQFARGLSGWNTNTGSIVESSLSRLPVAERPTNGKQLRWAVQGLLDAPENRDAEIVARLSRVAFGVQLVLASPRQTLFHQYALPRTVYLDASVLLPTITAGHPLEPVYKQVIVRLADAARHAGISFSISVGHQFLNEIVAHQKRAVEMVQSGGLEDPETLRRHIQFYSAVNTNVFVGAYGTMMATDAKLPTFAGFLEQIAPYADETQLATYLETKGIQTVRMQFKDKFNNEFISILNPLKSTYETIDKEKAAILVEHEAQQLTQLRIDTGFGVNSVFVTADGKLRRAVAHASKLRDVSGLLLSHLGLVALTDVMVGIDGTDAGSLARMMWLSADTDEEQGLVEYFVNLGLRKYDESMSSDLQSLAEKCAKDAKNEARSQGLDLSTASKQLERTAKFLDRFENRFYESWDEAIRRRHGEK